SAWNAKDVESITTLYRSLDRKTVKAQLAPVTAIRMTITPASAAQIDGERATIVCRRQVYEAFSDGTEKQTPDVLVTFTLSKRGGPRGLPWEESELQKMMDAAKAADLSLGNLMIVGFPNTIYGRPGRDEEIEKLQQSIRAAGKVGLPVVEYNFYAHRAMEGYIY